MKVTKSQLKELIRQAIVEDIMDKEIKNPKTGNKIKVRTALQLPGDHPANKMAKKLVAKSPIKKDKTGDDVGGPSYADVPKGAKSSKQAKVMKKNDSVAKKLNPNVSNSNDLVMNGMADDIDEFMNEIPDMGQDFEKADELLNLVRDNEQGQRDDDDDVIEDYKKGILKALNTPGKGGSGKSGKDIDKQAMSAADAANAKMDKDEKINKAKDYLKNLQKALKGAEPGSAFASMYQDNIKKAKETLKKLQTESKKRRYTVKEVRMWMKKLEENRYKKVYNSDARRVAWMVNNEGVSLDEMPISMKKKWTKAQYGRERYLATEFLKSKSEQMTEGKLTEDKFIAFYKKDRVTVNAKSLWDAKKQIIAKLKVPKKDVGLVSVLNKTEYDKQKFRFEQKLRKSIREIIKEQLNEKSFGDVRKIKFDKKDGKKIANIITSKKYKLTTPLYKIKGKDIELHIPKKEYNKAVEFFMKNKLNPRG